MRIAPICWLIGAIVFSSVSEASAQDAAPRRPNPSSGFSIIRAPSPEAREAAAQDALRAGGSGSLLGWSLAPQYQPQTVPRPQAVIFFQPIGPNIALPPRPVRQRGSLPPQPSRTPSRRQRLGW